MTETGEKLLLRYLRGSDLQSNFSLSFVTLNFSGAVWDLLPLTRVDAALEGGIPELNCNRDNRKAVIDLKLVLLLRN